jgi:predicted lipoprotein with Yx(FWY)xxD motif
MMRTRGVRTAAAGLVLSGLSVLLVLAPSAGAATTPRTARVISTATNSKLGTILVADRTVYTLKPSKTACTATCLKLWPPVLLPRGVTTATAGTGVDASKLGTVAAPHGAHQVTWSGKRLYWFSKDKAPGQVHGNMKNQWGKWSTVVMPTAAAAPTTAPPTTAAPATAPPATDAPATEPPATEPPATEAPATSPPATQPAMPPPTNKPSNPGTGGIAF